MALRDSEEKYRRILENLQDAYFRGDERGIVTMANPKAARMFGYGSADGMIGIPVVSVYCQARDRDNILQKMQETGELTDYTVEGVRKDGTTFWGSLNAQFIRDESGRIRGTEGIVRDITERKSMEHAIREANRKLNLLNSITRHDIANQLTMLQGFGNIAAKKESDPVIAEYLSKIHECARMIRRQIEFMKTYHELGVHTPGWLRLDETIAKAAGDTVLCSDTVSGIEIFSDPMLEKVFFNLFENAARHGGHVTEIHVTCTRVPDGLVITVEDNGVGVPPGEKEQIFEKGFGKNSGFGLFLAKEILSITGITLRETGDPGRGARFEIAVPKEAWRNTADRT